MSCDICVEDFDEKRVEIECLFCGKSACSVCCEKNFLDSTHVDMSCMHCRKVWTLDFVEDNFSKKFVTKKLREHQEKMWLIKEKIFLPVVQLSIERERKIRGEIEKLLDTEQQLRVQLHALGDIISEKMAELSTQGPVIQIEKEIIRNCPANDCRGFLNSEWSCGMCGKITCKKCRVLVGGEDELKKHTCKKEDIKTAKLIEEETKPCPKCGVRISKSSGCDQMWCVHCNTAFNWKTGKLETGPIHNPHFFEWAKKNWKDTGRRDACDTLPQYVTNPLVPTNTEAHKKIIKILMTCIHINETTEQGGREQERENKDLQLRFLKKEIDEKKWGALLTKRKKEERKKRAFADLKRTLVTVSAGLFREFQGCKEKKRLQEITDEFEKLREFFNEESIKISKRFSNCVCILLDDNWVRQSHRTKCAAKLKVDLVEDADEETKPKKTKKK